MDVRVRPTRDDEAAADIDDLRVGRVASQLGRTADRGHTAVPQDDRRGGSAIADVYATAVQQQRAAHGPKPARPRSGTKRTAP